MVALDTNVLVRFLTQDDEKQAKQVLNCLRKAERKKEELLIPQTVILELIWVLESAYGFQRLEILKGLEALGQMPVFRIEAEDALEELIRQGRETAFDLSDLFIALTAKFQGSEKILTFDRKASKHPLFELLK